jgi:ribosome maturation factor RimP
MQDKLTEKIEALIMPCIAELSADLVELNVKHRGTTTVIDIVADKPEGGITIGECTSINKKISRQIEQEQWFGEDFIVEVASPGLDRALKTSKDFLRVLGRNVRFHLLQMLEGKLEHIGKVIEVNDDEVLVKTNDKTITIPLTIISKSVQVIE